MTAGLPKLTERAFQAQVIHLARLCGWRVAHFRPARTNRGWRTPVEADGAGFPDLVLVKRRVIWAEVKTDDGKLSPAQQEWIQRLEAAGQHVAVWRPKDWGTIVEILSNEALLTGRTP